MNYYLVDFENVRTDGIKDLSEVNDGDVVVIFYSDQCKNITLDVIANMTRKKISLTCFKVKTGTKNALDFQLSSYLGLLIGQEQSDANYYIVSNDKGYDCICEFWKEQSKTVERKVFSEQDKEITVAPVVKASTAEKKKRKVQASDLATIDEMKNYLSKSDSPEEVLVIFNQFKTKQAICNGMSKKFKDSKRASAVYKKLKPLLKEKNKS